MLYQNKIAFVDSKGGLIVSVLEIKSAHWNHVLSFAAKQKLIVIADICS